MKSQLEIEVENFKYPPNFVQTFENMEEFEEWCRPGTPDELQCMLAEYNKFDDLFEHCIIIKKLHDEAHKNL